MTDSPTTARTDIAVANNALAMLAGGSIMSFDEDTDLAAKVNATYVDIIESCLGAHLWTFSLTTASLQLLEETPINGYRHAFALPADRIALPIAVLESPTSRHPLRDFAVMGGNLYAGRSALWANYRRRPEVAMWPSAFRLFATRALAASLCIPVTQDATLAAAFEDMAWGSANENRRGGLFAKAMTQDLSHPGPQAIWATDPLTSEWSGGGTGSWHGG